MIVKRSLIFCLGVLILAFGVVLNTKLNLGVSSMAILPVVVSRLSPATLGQTTIVFYLILVLAQFFLIRKVRVKILLQIPFSFVFGLIVDGFDRLLNLGGFPLILGIFLLLVAILIIAFGVYLMVSMNLVLNPADGIVQTIAEVRKGEFGQIKRVLDISLVTLSLIISWMFSGQLLGFGIGTILSALFIGQVISYYKKWFAPKLQDWVVR